MPLFNQLQAGDLAPYTFGNVELTHCHYKPGTKARVKKAKKKRDETKAAAAAFEPGARGSKKATKSASDAEQAYKTTTSTAKKRKSNLKSLNKKGEDRLAAAKGLRSGAKGYMTGDQKKSLRKAITKRTKTLSAL